MLIIYQAADDAAIDLDRGEASELLVWADQAPGLNQPVSLGGDRLFGVVETEVYRGEETVCVAFVHPVGEPVPDRVPRPGVSFNIQLDEHRDWITYGWDMSALPPTQVQEFVVVSGEVRPIDGNWMIRRIDECKPLTPIATYAAIHLCHCSDQGNRKCPTIAVTPPQTGNRPKRRKIAPASSVFSCGQQTTTCRRRNGTRIRQKPNPAAIGLRKLGPARITSMTRIGPWMGAIAAWGRHGKTRKPVPGAG